MIDKKAFSLFFFLTRSTGLVKAEFVSPTIPGSFHSLTVSLDISRSEARFHGAMRNGKPRATNFVPGQLSHTFGSALDERKTK